mmetsp:Transcript_22681/g.37846  ORF Transcript_22681/g.37846 Transcript_22681/m.37846 type:complete len:448 (-) Transcript_22681:98-1441(-)
MVDRLDLYNGGDGNTYAPSPEGPRVSGANVYSDGPRSKMISLGLKNLQHSPVRFRPLPKASDFPFEAPKVSSGRDQHEDYSPSKTSFYAKFHEKDPNVLRDQLTDFQKQLIAEQNSFESKYPDSMLDESNIPKDKVLSLGLKYKAGPISPRGISPRGYPLAHPPLERDEVRSKANEFARKLQLDEEQNAITPSRAKFVRPGLVDYDPNHPDNYLAIGSQIDKDVMLQQKRQQQIDYQQQLSQDMLSKPVEIERKQFERKLSSPAMRHTHSVNKLGETTESQILRRDQAREVLEANRSEVLLHMSAGSPEDRRNRRNGVHPRAAEIAKFETAPFQGFGQGYREAGDPESARKKKIAMQQQYLSQLLADNGPPVQGKARGGAAGDGISDKDFVDRTGWTGLQIGAGQGDPQASQNEKHLKQAAYKRLLDQQKMMRADIDRENIQKYGKY